MCDSVKTLFVVLDGGHVTHSVQSAVSRRAGSAASVNQPATELVEIAGTISLVLSICFTVILLTEIAFRRRMLIQRIQLVQNSAIRCFNRDDPSISPLIRTTRLRQHSSNRNLL